MHKFCLLLLSLCVFTSALHAGEDKENGEANSLLTGLFKRPIASQRRASVGTPHPQVDASQLKIEDSKALTDEVKSLSEKLKFVYDLARGYDTKIKESETRVYKRIDASQERQSQQVGELDKKITDLTTSAIKLSERVKARFDSQVVEKVDHDLQPDVDGLKSQLQELLQKTATYEEQLQSAATKEEFEQVKKDLEATINEIHQTVEELSTSDEVKEAMRDLTEGFKSYFVAKSEIKKYFATKSEMLGLFVEKHKVDQSVVSDLKKDIATVKKQMKKYARNADVDGRVDALKKQMATKSDLQSYVTQDALAAQLVDKANRSDLNGYATKDDMQEIKEVIPTAENPQGFARKEDIKGFVSQETHQETIQKFQEQITALEKNSPKEQLKSILIYGAKQGALGCVAYQLSPHMASLLRSLKLENSYVDLETVAVPTTTFAVSLLARLAKEGYDKGQDASLQEVGKETLLDTGVSAGIMGLRYFCFDDQMNEYVNHTSEQNRAAGYAFSYALLRSLVALFA